MKRSRLKNIINKSKELSNKTIGESSFDKFKKSLPIEVDDNYRLESAWKAYGKPKDYKEALWQGLIQPIDKDNIKLPSIGYNEETDEYEYLNKGRENETVDKDIRVWDNDVIPLVKELKQGGFIRVYDEEKDCWKYSKNSQKRELPVEDKGKQVIGSFQKGGKPEYKKIKSDKAYYDKDSDIVYYTNDEDLIHEGFHARPDFVLLEQLKPYYENLNDEKILNFGGNLLFVKRFEGDPGHFYSPEELGARISAAKFRTKGNNYTPEFFKYLRTNENLYGDNMRDLLYMYNDENLSKIFNIGNTQTFKQGGQQRNLEDLVLYARKKNPRFMQRFNEEPKAAEFKDEKGETLRGSHVLGYTTADGYDIVFPNIQEDENGNLKYYENWREALENARKNKDILFLNPGEGEIFTSNYKKSAFIKPYIDKWNSQFSDLAIPIGAQAFKQGGQMNIIPEGALHARKNNMEGAGEDFTAKGIPVMSNDGEQVAEIEKNEIVFNKEVTDFIEKNYKEFNSDEISSSEKDELAIKVGKRLVKEILENTDDRTGLIEEVANKNNLEYTK